MYSLSWSWSFCTICRMSWDSFWSRRLCGCLDQLLCSSCALEEQHITWSMECQRLNMLKMNLQEESIFRSISRERWERSGLVKDILPLCWYFSRECVSSVYTSSTEYKTCKFLLISPFLQCQEIYIRSRKPSDIRRHDPSIIAHLWNQASRVQPNFHASWTLLVRTSLRRPRNYSLID